VAVNPSHDAEANVPQVQRLKILIMGRKWKHSRGILDLKEHLSSTPTRLN